jgi:hypothetical protein
MKLLKIGIAAAAATTLAWSSAASAATSTPASSRNAVGAVISEFTAAHNQQGLREFRAASPSTQREFARALSGGSDISKLMTTGRPVTDSVSTRRLASPLGAETPGYTTYSVTSEFHVPAKILGITIATYHQVYEYETGNNRVLRDYNCRGYWNGFTGIDTFDYSESHHVTGGDGYCTVYDQVSLIYKGLGATYEKKGYMQVNYHGIVTWYLKND